MNRKKAPSFIGILSTSIAIAAGTLVLAGYFFPLADGQDTRLADIRLVLLGWAIVLAGVAVLIGVANLSQAHLRKIKTREKGWGYSLLLVVALALTFLLGLVSPDSARVVFTTIQIPVETALMALLVVTLTYASIRLLRRRLSLLSVVFLVSALLLLLATAPLPFLGSIPGLSDVVRPYLAQVLAVGGARGILIGVALGTLTTGLRILLGADRPYGGE